MKYKAIIFIIDPDSLVATSHEAILQFSEDTLIDNNQVVIAFFRQWEQQDKYEKIYYMGVNDLIKL